MDLCPAEHRADLHPRVLAAFLRAVAPLPALTGVGHGGDGLRSDDRVALPKVLSPRAPLLLGGVLPADQQGDLVEHLLGWPLLDGEVPPVIGDRQPVGHRPGVLHVGRLQPHPVDHGVEDDDGQPKRLARAVARRHHQPQVQGPPPRVGALQVGFRHPHLPFVHADPKEHPSPARDVPATALELSLSRFRPRGRVPQLPLLPRCSRHRGDAWGRGRPRRPASS